MLQDNIETYRTHYPGAYDSIETAIRLKWIDKLRFFFYSAHK